MDLKITYLIDNNLKTIENSNGDLDIEYQGNGSTISLNLHIKKSIILKSICLKEHHQFYKNDSILVNGYQSWTDTKELSIKDHLKNVNKLPKRILDMYSFKAYGDAAFKCYSKHILHGFDMAYIRGENPIFIGSKNYANAYLIINFVTNKNEIIYEADVNGYHLNQNDIFKAFDFICTNSIDQGMKEYFDSYELKTKDKIFGYTSWYNHYQNINEEIISNNLEAIDSRFNLFQIDDGFESYVGDWLSIDENKFPNGLELIVDKIKGKGLLPGIWLAPFVAEKNSKLFKEHRDWFLANESGEPICCGCNWSGFYALDIYNQEARAYILETLKYYVHLGFDLFKLDFLYAINNGRYKNKTRAMVTEDAYSLLREALKGKLILGCGAILSNSFNKFEYLRIGPDVSLKFDDVWYMKFMHRERISTKVTIQNTIYRSFLNEKVFLNDPDVFLLRDENIELSKKQKEALATINALFGSVLMTSDDIKNYDQEKRKQLDHILAISNRATSKYYKRIGNNIEIDYELDGIQYHLTYNPKKGVFIYG